MMTTYDIRNRGFHLTQCAQPPRLDAAKKEVYALVGENAIERLAGFDEVGGVKENGWRVIYPFKMLVGGACDQ